MRRLAILAAAAAALVVATGASAATPTVLLRLNDAFVPKGTNILCGVDISKTLVPGAKLLSCLIATRGGAIPNTYTVALAVNGEVALARLGAKGKLTVVTRRGVGGPYTPESGSGKAGKVYQAEVGSTYIVKGTAIACAVVKQTVKRASTTAVTCFKLSAAGKPRPNSYGIGITNANAFLVHFDANSKATPIDIVTHGR